MDPPSPTARRSRSPLAFFLLVFALSVPFLWIGAATGVELLPRLPVSALGAFCPMIAASILVYREDGTAGVVALLRRTFLQLNDAFASDTVGKLGPAPEPRSRLA